MKEIRIHARAGQGAITTAALVGQAVFAKEKYAYAFPNFGAARMGAPMNSFVRIDDKPIRLRSQVYYPDYVLVVDPTLMRGFNVFEGMKENGIAIINVTKTTQLPQAPKGIKVYSLAATDIAVEIIKRPLGNTVLLGAFAAASGLFDLKDLNNAMEGRFGGEIAKLNQQAAEAGFNYIKENYK
ncbi:MAG: 2-oxoacid:acceptor oxidoreductase family protein [Candidatus Omnitrophota bacterium]